MRGVNAGDGNRAVDSVVVLVELLVELVPSTKNFSSPQLAHVTNCPRRVN